VARSASRQPFLWAAAAVFLVLVAQETPGFLAGRFAKAGTAEVLATAPKANIILADRLAGLVGGRPIYVSPDSHLYLVSTHTFIGAARFHSGLNVKNRALHRLVQLRRDKGVCIFVCTNGERRNFVRQAFPGGDMISTGVVPCEAAGPSIYAAGERNAGPLTLDEARTVSAGLLDAWARVAGGNVRAGLGILESLGRRWPRVAGVHSMRASIHFILRDYGSARTDATRALELSGRGDSRALGLLAWMAAMGGDLRTAEKYWSESLSIDPCWETNWFNLAFALRKTGRGRDAVQAAAQGLRLFPGSKRLREMSESR
jgi:hypothetical protein